MKNLEALDNTATELCDAAHATLVEVADRYYADQVTGTEYQLAKDVYRAALEARTAIRTAIRNLNR